MKSFIKLFSNKNNEIYRFLQNFYCGEENSIDKNLLEWKKTFENPVEMADMIGVFIDNNDNYKINMWICIDKDVLLNVSNNNVDDIIRYLYERFPY